MRLLALIALMPGLVPMILGALERAAIPSVELEHPVWEERDASSSATVDHAAWDAFLARYRSVDGAGMARVDYAAVTPADDAALDAYVDALEATDTRALAGPEQLAFWINLYNAATVDLVLQHYPVDSIREIEGGFFDTGPWDEEVATVLGRTLSLNDIEHRIIRAVWNEPRIHYAVNCAAVGCPDLGPEAYRGDRLEAQLAAAERLYVNDPRGVRLEGDELVLSKIFFWFRKDFGPDEAAVLERLRPVAEGRAAAALAGRTRVDSYAYDWALNAP